MVDTRRTRARNQAPLGDGPVIYWMQRDQRAHDNWALLYAQAAAIARSVPLYVLFNLVPTFGHATRRQYDFMLAGLAETTATLAEHRIPFVLTEGAPEVTIAAFVRAHDVGEVVTDFNPLALPESWKVAVATALPVRLTEVDAHNIIPAWVASEKEEFAAYTFRPKVHRQLSEWLVELPALVPHPYPGATVPPPDWEALAARLDVDAAVPPVSWATPGSVAGTAMLEAFLSTRLEGYATRRNDPNLDALSNLSPYFHFGQLAAQRVALAVQKAKAPKVDRDAYLEELIVRRELADNFCFYSPAPDQIEAAHAWARETLAAHAGDPREHLYDRATLEAGETHDDLWNAAQRQMVVEGKMHGWCRMYWAKKLLEWTPDPQTAVDVALYLNDKYELDGRDPNGIVGVMWSICGVHDRAWTERPIFGKIRYMNYSGAKRKFDVKSYVARYSVASPLFA